MQSPDSFSMVRSRDAEASPTGLPPSLLRDLMVVLTQANFLMTLVVAAALAGIAFSAKAQAPAPQQAATQLDAVVVGASRSDTKLDDMALHTTVVTRDDIAKSPATTLDQLLRSVPGFNFTGVPTPQSDPTGHQTRMRGLGNAKVLVLLDGVPIHDPFYLTTQWFKVPLYNIERVEVVRGGNSSLWGNMAVAGVVNIVSRRAFDNAGYAELGYGTGGSINIAASKNIRASESLGFNLSVDEVHAMGYQSVPIEHQWRYPRRNPVDTKNTNAVLTAWFKPTADLSGYARFGYHVQDQDISYQFGSNIQQSPDASAGLTQRLDANSTLAATVWAQYVQFEKYNGATCYWQAAAAPANRCPATAAVTRNQVNQQVVDYYTQYGSQRYREKGGSLIWSRNTLSPAWDSVQLGADYRQLSATDLEFFFSAPQALNQPQRLNSTTYGKADQAFKGLFAQTRVMPLDRLAVTVSARFDRWENTGRFLTRTTAAGATTGGQREDSSKSALNPGISARYAVTDEVDLRAAGYKSFRAPGFNNTTRTFGAATPTIANPDLGPETLTGWELGSDYAKGPLSVSATYFLYRIRNQIATFRVNNFASAPDLVRTICGAALANCGGSANFYTNDQDGESRGLELVARYKASKELTLDATYTHTDSVLVRTGPVVTDPIGVQIAGIPKDVVTLAATWQAMPRLRTFAEARYIGRMLVDSTSVRDTYFWQGGATVFNASLSYAVDPSMDVVAGVQNLFDKEYSENTYTWNQPFNQTLSLRRTVNVGVRARF